MEFSDELRGKFNKILALVFTLIAFFFLVIKFDVFYDLNDDVLMKDILSGIYAGTPKTRNLQMLYPLSFLLAVLYDVIPFVPWYGMFLFSSQFVCMYLITERSMHFCAKFWVKAVLGVSIILTWCSLLLYHFTYLQYTVTAGLLVGTALFRFMTNYSADPEQVNFIQDVTRVTQDNMPVGLFVRKNIGNIILLVLAFCLRSEMALLTLPLVGFAYIVKWAEEEKPFGGKTIRKFFLVLAAVVGICLISFALDKIAYSRTQWQQFRDLFDARTEIYDFQENPPSYEENQEFYDSIGVSKEEVDLMTSYNYGISENLDSDRFVQIAEYGKEIKELQVMPTQRMRNAIWRCVFEYFSEDHIPWVFVNIGLLCAILISALMQEHVKILWELVLFIVFRTIPWIYLYYRGRVIERVTTPLLFVEAIVLLARLLMEFGMVVEKQSGYSTSLRRMRILTRWQEIGEDFMHYFPTVVLIVSLIYGGYTGMLGYEKTVAEQNHRQKCDSFINQIAEYRKEHMDTYYLMDVYSSTSYTLKDGKTTVFASEKVFSDVSTTFSNYDLLGGWNCKSPLQKDKLAYAEKKEMHPEAFQIMALEGRDLSPILNFYESIGKTVELELVESLENKNVADVMNVYAVTFTEAE